MNRSLIILFGTLAFLLNSCVSEEDSPTMIQKEDTTIILQNRSSEVPSVRNLPYTSLSIAATRGISDNSMLIGNSDVLLGYSYSIGNSIMGDMENVRFQVLDLNKIKSKYPTSIVNKQLSSNRSYSFTYNGFSRYESASQVSKTVKTGFKLDLGLFSFGREKKTTEIFKSSSSYGTEGVFGELNLEIRNGQFELLSTADKRKIYARECLTSTFQTDLYRGTIGNLIYSYGPFVLRSYVTGAKATALYSGRCTKYNSAEYRENGLDKDINASFSWKSNSTSGSLTFGRNNGSSDSISYETTGTEVYIQTYGGKPALQAIIGATSIKNLSVDLTPWLNSISTDNNTIIDITSGSTEEECGLYPMSDFVLEKNFKYRMDDTTLGLLESLEDVQDPRFEIVKVLARTTSAGENLYEVAAVLNTRQGDKIVLSDGAYVSESDASLRANNNNTAMMSKVQEIFDKKKLVFQGLEFKTNYSTTYNPNVRKPLCVRLDGFDENKMYFYADPNSRMRYIYDPAKRIALSYIDDEDYGDYILDYYGIRDWVEGLSQRSTSMMILQSYTIIGL